MQAAGVDDIRHLIQPRQHATQQVRQRAEAERPVEGARRDARSGPGHPLAALIVVAALTCVLILSPTTDTTQTVLPSGASCMNWGAAGHGSVGS